MDDEAALAGIDPMMGNDAMMKQPPGTTLTVRPSTSAGRGREHVELETTANFRWRSAGPRRRASARDWVFVPEYDEARGQGEGVAGAVGRLGGGWRRAR